MLGFTLVCLAASELMPAPRPSSEVLVKLGRRKRRTQDVEGKGGESGSSEALWRGFAQAPSIVEKRKDSSSTLYWSDLSLRVSKGKSTLQLLDRVDGWVKPGSVTALMGVSGAGKTTLLDTLASRTAVGVVAGEIWLGKATTKRELRARDMGYVQQKDMHLPTSSVREALTFSALVRQRSGSGAERRQYVDEVIALLGLEDCADAVIGENGESLNARQRKMLAIGIELAAKPDVLLFLDEPTSGQDAQAAWNMVAIFRQIANAGLGVLCTIHQPSGLLLEQFDSLLLLAQGGRTVYFGGVGQDLDTVVQYFVRNGAEELRPGTNPAEWILHLANAPASLDWPAIWRGSPEYVSIKEELRENDRLVVSSEVEALTQTPFWTQFCLFARRTLQNYWRTPWYIYSKAALCCWSALFVGFSFFNAPTSLQGLQNQMLAVFMLCTIGSQLAQQMLAQYVPLRNLFEVYELPAGAYAWPAFLVSHVLIEQLWNSLMAVVIFFCWFYPVGFTNALDADDAHSRSATMFLFLWLFLAFVGSLELLAAAAANSAEGAGNLSNLAFTLSLLFCGILASPDAMPRFWIFMYRVSPFTYIVEGILSVGLAGKRVTCADNEILTMQPRQDETCGEYLSAYVRQHGGEVLDPAATRDCRYCPVTDSGAYLSQSHIEYGHRWRNVGILLAYIAFNIGVAFFLHWRSRFRKREAKKRV
ncbi:ABC transporter-like protein [Macrophomina phaseolina MS6]|uniref:ABC transporter-like protein n=1 Tax=Macrophomina phaseolina (strain MS6) TaxID=1126212 RepID=K2SYT9_MACPH|nr:ABC transporter-like protein [Macrophomina phaseolina MS6]